MLSIAIKLRTHRPGGLWMTTVLHGAQCVVVRYCRGRPGRPRTSRNPDVTTCGRLWADVPCVDRRNVEEGMRLREAHEEIVAVARGYTQVLSSAVVEGEGLTQLLCSTSPKDGHGLTLGHHAYTSTKLQHT